MPPASDGFPKTDLTNRNGRFTEAGTPFSPVVPPKQKQKARPKQARMLDLYLKKYKEKQKTPFYPGNREDMFVGRPSDLTRKRGFRLGKETIWARKLGPVLLASKYLNRQPCHHAGRFAGHHPCFCVQEMEIPNVSDVQQHSACSGFVWSSFGFRKLYR